MRKKILHISQATGGVRTYTSFILGYGDIEKFSFVVIATPNDDFQEFCKLRGIPYYPLDMERDTNLFRNLFLLRKIIRVIRQEKPDLLHVHSAKAGFLGRLASKITKVSVIYTPHAFSYLSFTGVKRAMFYLLEVAALKWTTMLLAISRSEARQAVNELGFPPDRVRVILNAIPHSTASVARDYSACRMISMIGRLTIQKNPILFLQIARRMLHDHPHLQFSILGAGIHDHLTNEIQDFLTKNDLLDKVKIHNWGNHEKSAHFLQEADILLSTSLFEGLPFSLLEAMSDGLPCVVSNVPGNTDVVSNNENGFTCSTLKEFCARLNELILDGAKRASIGSIGKQYVRERHNLATAIKQIERVYAGL